MNRQLLHVGAAIAIGIGLRFVVNLEPVWWLAWFVPGLLLGLALRVGPWAARGYIAVAAAIGLTANVPFFLSVMPARFVILTMTLQVLLWLLVIGVARRIMLAFHTSWTVLALPLVGVAADTLLAHFTPDGNWGSLAYTQADVLPVAQIASVFGMGGVLFVLLLLNGAVALALHRGLRDRRAVPAHATAVLVFIATVGFGFWRLQSASDEADATARRMTFGIVSIDDYLASAQTRESDDVWLQYQAQVTALAAGGAKVVLLPEKINVLPASLAERLKKHLGTMARDNGIWLVAGLGVDDGRERRNEAWWFAPDGRLVTNYLKHFMAPPEREFVPGHEFPVNEIEGVTYGVAICKDMHFASLGRGFGQRDAAVMLVPAWDFRRDAWLATNMTKMRGVESGFAVVRSSRDGLLSVSDAYGRMLASAESTSLPGTSLFASVAVGPRVPTIYTRIGDLLGWLCVAGLLLLGAGWKKWGHVSFLAARSRDESLEMKQK
ncbi:MAG TPA: nitrilase-related carbon-nitrogen hydrolase [Steroidobacteraceae bacterium]